MTALYAMLGAGLGAGLWIVIASLRVATTTPRRPAPRRWAPTAPALRVGLALVAALVVLAITRWPSAVLGAAVLGWFAPDVVDARQRREAGVERAVAVAAWSEMLRDTLAASSGLEEAIAATAPLTAPSIRPAVERLVTEVGRSRLVDALGNLADDLADPTADLVVSALVMAARGEAQNLIELLGSLAEAARDDAEMRLRVDASRARIRTSVRVIAGVTVSMVGALVVLNRSYLAPFNSAQGQVVLAAILVGFGGGLAWLASMSRYRVPDRFLARRTGEVSP